MINPTYGQIADYMGRHVTITIMVDGDMANLQEISGRLFSVDFKAVMIERPLAVKKHPHSGEYWIRIAQIVSIRECSPPDESRPLVNPVNQVNNVPVSTGDVTKMVLPPHPGLARARAQGADAAHRGAPMIANPYVRNQYRQAWNDGWREAKEASTNG